jgi:hypothetical protein
VVSGNQISYFGLQWDLHGIGIHGIFMELGAFWPLADYSLAKKIIPPS